MADERWYKGERHCIVLVKSNRNYLVKFDNGETTITYKRLLWRHKKNA